MQAVYGEKRTGGTPHLSLAEGRRLTIALRMQGAVITGTLGSPAASCLASRFLPRRFRTVDGVRTRDDAGGSATTDDRGTYRIFGLPRRLPRLRRAEVTAARFVITDAEFQWADRQMQSPSSSTALGLRGGSPQPAPGHRLHAVTIQAPWTRPRDSSRWPPERSAAAWTSIGVRLDSESRGTIWTRMGSRQIRNSISSRARRDHGRYLFFLDAMMGRGRLPISSYVQRVRPGDYTIAARE